MFSSCRRRGKDAAVRCVFVSHLLLQVSLIIFIYIYMCVFVNFLSYSSCGFFYMKRGFYSTTPTAQRKLENKIALITGGARGIGKATAANFITNGAKVIIADIHRELGHQTAVQLGPKASFVHCDVTKEADVSDAVDFAVSLHGRLDIMFNNAGIACRTSPTIADLDLTQFDRVMAINVRGVMIGMKHASRVMIPRRSGSIVCTGSVTGVMGGMSQHTYSVSKSAVIGIVKSLSSELCRFGVRVNCISPTVIPTEFVLEETSHMYPGVSSCRLEAMVHGAGILEGANCEPNDVANAALYLASEDAKYVSGHNLVVDGGLTAFKSFDFPEPNQVR